jgi:hypothetical protein
MPETLTLTGFDELQDLYDGVAEDFADIDFTPWMEGELHDLSTYMEGLFANQASPDQAAWKPNAESTIKAKGHARVLRGKPRFGFRLSKSLTTKATSSSSDMVREAIQTDTAAYMGFGTNVEYALFNDQGTRQSPARPFIGIDERYLDSLESSALDHALTEMAKG